MGKVLSFPIRLAKQMGNSQCGLICDWPDSVPKANCYRAPDGSSTRARVLRRIFSGFPSDVRLCMETCRFSVDGNLGRKSQPHQCAMEWENSDPRDGIWRHSHAESRHEMTDRDRLFDIHTCRCRWLPPKSRIEVEYCALVRRTDCP